jgi:hypothetical protein
VSGLFDDNPTSTRAEFFPSAKDALHCSCCFATHAREQVTVSVEGDRDGGVSEQFLNQLDVCALAEHQGCAGVAEVVQADTRQPSTFQDGLLVNLAYAGHASAREMALELARSGDTPWHVRWRRWLNDISEEKLTATIRSALSQSIDRIQQTEDGFRFGVGGLFPMFFRDWNFPEEVRTEAANTLAEAAVDSWALIRDRQEAATMLGLKADQFDNEGRRRAIEALTPLLTDEVDVHPAARSIDNPLSAAIMNVGQPDDIKAAVAYALLKLSEWMTQDERRLLMRDIEKLRASQIDIFGTSVSGGLRSFKPDNKEEERWLQTRLLLLMNSPHPAVRENTAQCVRLMMEEGLLRFNPELIDTLLFLASSPLVADRTGAGSALSRIGREGPWHQPGVDDVIEALKTDASFFVRHATQRPDEFNV